MASNKLEGGKCKGGGDVKAGLRHNDCSPEMREIAAKGNPDIDTSKSYLNVNLTGDTYQQRCKKYDARIEALDAMPGANKRKDRVTGQKIETPVPADLPREQYNEFLSRVLDIQREMFGAENLIGADIHWDEEHDYTDPETKETVTSRVHLQSIFVPVKDNKLNGQAIYNRATMRELNKKCEEMAVNEFGVNFMTGKGKSSESIAELKAKSKAAAIIAKAEEQAAEKIAEADKRLAEADEKMAEADKRMAEADKKMAEAEKERESVQNWAGDLAGWRDGEQRRLDGVAAQIAAAVPTSDAAVLAELDRRKGRDGQTLREEIEADLSAKAEQLKAAGKTITIKQPPQPDPIAAALALDRQQRERDQARQRQQGPGYGG